ncbi:ArnT family glycosyltransferase [Mesorhizobium marinum]|uniref:ArnT family glycosyltransferase n=1 Tax=Mesorhizobium marinum TaxID=3228790 RepID=UPI0034661CD8
MLTASRAERLLPYGLLAAFFCVSILVRPLLPVDETRYLSVAWEMYVRQDFLVPTMNFAPYFQKPPLLFWLIDLAWGVLGVSRFAAVLVIFAVSSLVIDLTRRLAVALFPDAPDIQRRVPWLLLGSVPFVLYSSLILFDLLLTACVLGCLLALLAYDRQGRLRFALLAGLLLGLGVLAKGPVILIHLAFPALLHPLWRQPDTGLSTRRFLAGFGLAVLVSAAIVAAWLGPALYSTGRDFAYGLVWEQSAGRVAGSAHGAHARPFYFYVLLTPLMLMPWCFFRDLWASRPWLRFRDGNGARSQDLRILRFLAVWLVGELLVFSAISGKQPHYLLPALPVLVLLLAYFMAGARVPTIARTAAAMLGLFAVGQLAASATIFYRYDLSSVAACVAANSDAELAFAGRYQGELTFLSRLEKPLTIVEPSAKDEWLQTHPDGYLIANMRHYPDATRSVACSQVFRSGHLVVLNGDRATTLGADTPPDPSAGG